jgi:hypothetical protein
LHSVWLVDGQDEHSVGLIEQRHGCRDNTDYGKKHQRQQRAYADKESTQWQHASERMSLRLGETMARTISVCDRESDIYEYLNYKCQQGHRFVVRAQADRRLSPAGPTLFKVVESQADPRYETTVSIAQRGRRLAREADVQVSTLPVTLQAPTKHPKSSVTLDIHVVVVEEPAATRSLKPIRYAGSC